jgi:hypothetical protein
VISRRLWFSSIRQTGRQQDRSAKVTRHNLDLVLNGHLDAVPLFQ